MILLLDTHVWFWALESPGQIGRKCRAALESRNNDLAVATISTVEFGQLQTAKRVVFKGKLESWVRRGTESLGLRMVELSNPVAVLAYALHGAFHKDPAAAYWWPPPFTMASPSSPRGLPTKRKFFRPSAIGRIAFSAKLLSISKRPSVVKRQVELQTLSLDEKTGAGEFLVRTERTAARHTITDREGETQRNEHKPNPFDSLLSRFWRSPLPAALP